MKLVKSGDKRRPSVRQDVEGVLRYRLDRSSELKGVIVVGIQRTSEGGQWVLSHTSMKDSEMLLALRGALYYAEERAYGRE